MGYTHYFRHGDCDPKSWHRILLDIGKLYSELPAEIVLTGCSKYGGLPYFGEDEIWFNGEPSHETFVLQRDGGNRFAFCKTAAKPYDLMVCACLLVYKLRSPETMELASDGNAEEWQEAIDFVRDTLGVEMSYDEVMN